MYNLPLIRTGRLQLRKLTPNDLSALRQYADHPRVSENVLNIPHPYREHHAALRLSYVVQGLKKETHYIFAIIHNERKELIGEISLHRGGKPGLAELAYWIGEPFWGNGYATEAARAVVRFGWENLGLHIIVGSCKISNPASARVLEKAGLREGKVWSGTRYYQLEHPDHKE